MVDIDSEYGAVIAAAAAAGAPIEAANAAKPESAGHDPMTTVRLSRDRILRALNDEAVAPSVPVAPAADRAPSQDEDIPDQIDPVAIAAAAISRLRARARTDLAELR